MPIPEEVDEINEFLQKRREKQRTGELPREDFAPGFAKKISLAIFGKPHAPEKSPLKSTQPTFASSQAQAAMRQQFDEIMESRPASSTRPNSTGPAPPKTSATILTPTAAKNSPVPRYYSTMPYPPYIQRGLSNLPPQKNEGTIPNPPLRAPTLSASPAQQARATVTTGSLPPISPTTLSPKLKSSPLESSTLPVSKIVLPPYSSARASPVLNNSPRSSLPIPPSPVRPATLSSNTAPAGLQSPPSPPTPLRTQPLPNPSTIKNTAPNTTKSATVPFWKKLFTKKEKSSPASTIIPPPSTLPSSGRPNSYYSAPPKKSTEYSPISTIHPISTTRDSSANTISPASSLPEKKNWGATNPLLPAVTPASAIMKPIENSPASPARTALVAPIAPQEPASLSARTNISSPLPSSREIKIISTEKKIAPAIISEKISQSTAVPAQNAPPYIPPWVARTIPRDESTAKPHATNLPWKQPFGMELNSPETQPPTPPKKISEMDENELAEKLSHEVSEEKMEQPRHPEETTLPALAEPVHDAATDEEISEEEALEKLPFEDVEGLSPSDLDYLSKKEKEHRQDQAEEDGDLGIPAELKHTLQRQSSQLEGALHASDQPIGDEKQEILRRLKKMMEEEHPK